MFNVRFFKYNECAKEYVMTAIRTMPEDVFYEFYSSADYEIANFDGPFGYAIVNLRYADADGDVPNRFALDAA